VKRILIESPTFKRKVRRLLKSYSKVSDDLQATLDAMGEDVFHPSLHTHKLHGQWVGCWASSAGYNLRIIFEFVQSNGSEAILLHTIGTHDEVY